MICKNCGKRIPDELLSGSSFSCPSCGKKYVKKSSVEKAPDKRRTASGKRRSSKKRTGRFVLPFIIAIIILAVILVPVTMLNKKSASGTQTAVATAPAAAETAEAAQDDETGDVDENDADTGSVIPVTAEMTALFDNMTETEDGISVYSPDGQVAKPVSISDATGYLQEVLRLYVTSSFPTASVQCDYMPDNGFSTEILLTLPKEDLDGILSGTDEELYATVREMLLDDVLSAESELLGADTETGIGLCYEGDSDPQVRVYLPAGAWADSGLGTDDTHPCVYRDELAATDDSAVTSLYAELVESSDAGCVTAKAPDGSSTKQVTVSAAQNYLQDAVWLRLTDKYPEITVEANADEDTSNGIDIDVTLALDAGSIASMTALTDEEIYAKVRTEMLEGIRIDCALLPDCNVNIGVNFTSADSTDTVVRVFLPAGIAIDTELQDDPEHPCVYRY